MGTEATIPEKVNSCSRIFFPLQQSTETVSTRFWQTFRHECERKFDQSTKEAETYHSFTDEPKTAAAGEFEITDTDLDLTMAGDKASRAPSTLSRIKEFEENMKVLGEDLDEERKKSTALLKENTKLEKYKLLDPENKELKKKNVVLEREIKKLEKNMVSQNEYTELKQKCGALEKDVKKLEKIKGFEDDYKDLKKNYATLKKEFKKLDEDKRTEEEYRELEKKCNALEKDIKMLTAEHEGLKPMFVASKTALDSIQEEKNELKVEVMTLTTRLTSTNTENDELKVRNAALMIENEKIKHDAARYKHENICKWKEELVSKDTIAELQKVVEQHASDTAELSELKQGIIERGETIQMNMVRIAGLEQTLQDRERAITALQSGQNAMAKNEIERTLQIHRLTEQIATDQDHNRYLYNKLAAEMHAYHANVYHLRVGANTQVPFPNSGGGYLGPPPNQYFGNYDANIDRSGRAYMDQEDRERRETPDERARREAGERHRIETDAGLSSYGPLGRSVVGSIHLELSGQQIGHAGVEAYYSQDPNVTGPFGYQAPAAASFQAAEPLNFVDEALFGSPSPVGFFQGQEES